MMQRCETTAGASIVLRPYQIECLDRIGARRAAGIRRMLVSLPTGTGKTVIFARFPSHFGMDGRLLVLAHREELLDQAAAKFRAANPTLTIGIERAEQRAGGAQVVIGSVPTLRGRRLQALRPEEFTTVVCDEAHHAVAPTYMDVFDHFGLLDPASPRMLVGFTATVCRGDGQSLGEVFEEIVYSKGIEEMIAAGYLCPIRGWRVRTRVGLDTVEERAGDFVGSQLARAVNTRERNEVIYSAWCKLAADRRTIVFCADVEHSLSVAQMFISAGVRAAAVYGSMARDQRRDILRRFHGGALDVVTNCNVLTEGFDEPAVSAIIMARPTKSLLLYAQMLGRGTRVAADKPDLAVIDVVDNTRVHKLAELNQMFGLPDDLDPGGDDVLEVAERLREVAGTMPWVDVSRIAAPSEIALVTEHVDLFRLEPPEEIAGDTDLAWMDAHGQGYRLPLPEGEYSIRRTLLGDFEICYRDRGTGRILTVGRTPNLAEAVRTVDARVERNHSSAILLLQRDAAWRFREPSEKQLAVLRSRGLPTPRGLTRGQASWMLAYVLGSGENRSAAG